MDMTDERRLPGRIMDKIDFDGPAGCWIWTAGKNSEGYGYVQWEGRQTGAHRVVFALLMGPIQEGLVIDHLCCVRSCVNPWHMETVTHDENIMRGNGRPAVNARKTRCPKGHPYDEENTIIRPGIGRGCRTCGNEWSRESMRRLRAERRAQP